MKKTLHFIHFMKQVNKAFYLLLFFLSSTIGFAQTITPTKTVTVAPGVCGALDVELKIQGSNPVARPLEVVLVIDVSGSMGDGNNPKPLSYAQDAANDFIDKMFLAANNPTGNNKVAIVTFSNNGTIRQGLTSSAGKAGLKTIINGLVANGGTNIEDGILKANQVLATATYNCSTARSMVLLTDGVANASATHGTNCTGGQQGTCIQDAIAAANAGKTVVVSGVTYNNQIFSVGLFGAINGSEQTDAQYTLNQIQSGGSFFTENAADLTGIYSQIFTQLSWVAKQIVGTPFEKETVDPNFIIGTVTSTKGTTTVTGQQIAWNIDFLNVETITLKYRLTPKPNTCGNQMVSTSRLDFQNALCVTTFQDITSPTTNVPCPIVTVANQTNVTCFGGNNGAITLNTPTGGQGPYTYKWTKNDVNFATTKDISGLTVGTYKVIATDNNNCATAILTINITQPAAALALAASSKTDATCNGASSGSVTAGAVTNSVGTVTYSWKNSSNVVVGTTASVTGLPAGTYTLTVTDSCSNQSNSVTIGQPASPLALAASSKTDASCNGASTGSVTAGAVTNSVGTVTYSWKNSSNIVVGTTATVTGLPAGTYTLTVTDSCSNKTNSVTIGQPAFPLTLAASSKTDASCYGASSGSVTAGAVTNFVGTVTYSWKNSSNVVVGTTASVTGLPTGTYTLTVTDSCSSQSNSVTIGQPSLPLALAASSKTDASCYGASSGSVTAGTVTNSVGTVTYSWKNSSNTVVGTTATVTGLPAGTYTLTVTDSCSSQSNSVTIGQPNLPLALAASSKTDASCYGASSGSVTAGAVTNFVGTVTYSWKNSSNVVVGTTASVTGLPAGTYTLTVTDSCSSQSNSVTIGQPALPLALAASSKTDASCYGASSGSVTAGTVTNSVGTVTYSWKNSSNVVVGTTASVTGLPAGTYTLTVTDSCSSQSNSVTIGQPSLPLALAASSKTDASCYGASSGSVTAGAVTNFVGTVTYSWKNSSNAVVGTTASVTGLPTGTYTLTVTDSCSSQSNSVTIGQPSLPLALAASSKTDASCYGASSGSVTAGLVTNSVGTISYSWVNSSNTIVGTTASVTGLPTGTYTLTVTDSCSSQSNSVTIGQPSAPLSCSITQNKAVTSNGLSDGEATVSPLGGNGNYTYLWDNNETTQKAIALNAGLHSVTVTDSKGCTTTCTITISQPNVLSCSVVQDAPAKCYGDNNGIATVTAIGGNGDYTYLWDNNETTVQATALTAGLHTVTITDKLGYKTTCDVTIGQPQAALTAAINTKTDVNCKGDATGSATASATGGNGSYSYSWNTNPIQTSATANNLIAGTYIVTVTDEKGCTDTEQITITEPELALTAAIKTDTNVNCKGDATGSATASATGGTGSYSYSWNTNPIQTSATATNLIAGTYIVTVTDEKGCTDTEQITITEPELALTAAINTDTNVNCKGDATGSATASATGGTGTYSYSWNTNPVQTSATANNLIAGTYIVTVTDEKGCTDTEQITITEPELSLTAAIKTDTNVNCKGDTTGSATASATGGTGSYSYSWNTNPVQTSATANNLIAGTYIVTVTDEKGCTDTEQITITEPELALTASKSQINASCGGASSGSATVVASGGTGPYTYSWNTNPEQTSATATNLLAGSYSVVITDSKGCTHTVSFEILDGDSVKPIINPLPETSTINCPAEPVFAQATATDDNGTIASLTYEDTVTPGNCAGSYTKTRTWTAKDACGNVSLPVSQTIIVQDITAPTWSTEVASLNKTIECSNAEALSSAQALFPVASDACDTDVSNIIKVSGQFVASETCSNAGTYTNTWTVKDDCGNTSDTFTQVITIQDTTAPTWSTEIASLNKTIECSNAEALASAQVLFPTATDACDTDVTNIVKVSGQFVANEGCANSGTYTNTWTVKDDCGNTSETFTQVITIQDTTAPTWSTEVASLNKTIECSNAEALSSAQALFPVASDACDTDVSNIIKVSGQFVASETCSNAGTYTNTWTVKDDCGNTSDTFTQVITIQDTTAPIFAGELPGDITVSCDAVPAAANVEASDNCNGNLPIVFSEVKSGIQNECPTNYTLTRKWTTSDCGGNTASYTQIITVRDTTPPTGTVPSNVANLQSITDIPAGSPGDITDAADNCSPTVNITVSDSHNEASGCDGNAYILTRTYTLTDCAGNKTELVRTFTVDNKVAINATVSNVTCLGAHDGSITVTNSPGSTVIIRNANNEIVGNTNLPAGTYTLTASSAVNTNNQTCTATTTVVITEPNYTIKISGQIINVDTNTPIANVPVTLIPQGTTTGPILLRITGVDGRYTFTGMPAGSYLVQVQDANLNSAHQLYPVDSSLFFTTLEDCKFQEHNFEYGKSNLPVLGDYVWYDTNGNGLQDEWYDANNDGVVTKNIPDAEGAIDFSLWEWIDFNGDGSYAGPQNAGELNAGGFGNAASPNVIVDGPNGYHKEVIVGIEGFWRDRPGTPNPYGDYNIKLVRDTNLDAVAAALGATGLVKVIPSGGTDKRKTSKPAKIAMHTVCQTTSAAGYIVTVTAEDLVHLDADFGVNCKEYRDIVANDDSAGPFPGVNHTTPNVLNVLPNDTIEGVVVTASDVIITTVTPNEFLQLNPDGSIDILPNAPAGTLTMVYQICEADQTSNCDTATVTVTIEAPTMTVTATAICVNDVPYLDYVVTPGNFTPVNGVTIAWADAANNVVTTITDLPLSGRVLWPGAVVDQAGNGIDWPGWVFQNNKWIQAPDGFEGLRPTANVTLSVNPSQTITVSYPPADPFCTARPTFAILANDDSAGPLPALTGATNVLNVYTNDTLNGDPVNPADVTLTLVTPDPTGALTLNPDGSVDVKVGTLGGTYTLTYQICENADNGNCDTAIVTVTVLNPPTPVDAVDDTYTVGCNTFGLVGNVLANDLKGNVPATLELVNFTLLSETSNESKTDPNITIDASGNVTVSSLTPPGTYTYSYRICDKLSAENCDTATITITVSPNGVTNIASKACNDDRTPIDLLALLPENTPRTGIWVDTDGSNALQGNVLNAFGLALGNYKFEYQIADENCPRSVLLNMEVNADCVVLACENIVIHNAFSPNGDGKNDVFVIDNIDQTTCYPENTVEIYNRWGILVFETTNYNNTTNAFDGTSRGRTTVKQSDGLPTGTYFYVVTYKSLDGNNVVQNHKLDGYLYLSK